MIRREYVKVSAVLVMFCCVAAGYIGEFTL